MGVVKLGHTDPRFDGEPAVGRLDNLRMDASGDVLLADLVGVPAPLAAILNSAYPSRSVEAVVGVLTASGDRYGLVVTGLALLGETAPAIQSLADVLTLFDVPTGVDTWTASGKDAASIDPTGAPMPPIPVPATTSTTGGARVLASATVDELVTQATAYAAANGIEWPWVREVYTDKVILGSDSGPAGRLWELEWTEAAGGLAFTGPYPVKIEYTRLGDTVAAAAAHMTTVPVRYVRGRGDVSASTPEEKPPVSDLAALVREQLGLASDADEDAIAAALAALKTKAETPAEPPAPPAVEEPAEPVAVAASAADIERIVAARVEAAVKPFEVKLEQTTTELANRREAERGTARDTLLASAVKAGKIAPAEVEGLRADYDTSPQDAAAITRMLGRIHAGAAVPTSPLGQ